MNKRNTHYWLLHIFLALPSGDSKQLHFVAHAGTGVTSNNYYFATALFQKQNLKVWKLFMGGKENIYWGIYQTNFGLNICKSV